MRNRAHLAPDDGVIELAGSHPIWIWAHTCPMPKCRCRTALLAATSAGHDVLLERGAPIRAAWNAGSSYLDAAAQVDGLLVFALDIDKVVAYPTDSRERLDLEEHAEVRAVIERLDGDVLESMGRLWCKGKGLPDPQEQARLAREVVARGWKPGEKVAWSDVIASVRNDLYVLDDRVYAASERYCLVPDCDCGEVVVRFETRVPRGGPPPGFATVKRSGETTIEATKNGSDRLERLWVAFQARHPRYRERFERRSSVMRRMVTRIVAKPTMMPSSVGRAQDAGR